MVSGTKVDDFAKHLKGIVLFLDTFRQSMFHNF